MPEIAYVNDKFLPLEQASISINDRGLMFADGIYEVIVTASGVPFLLESHLERLYASAKSIKLELPWHKKDLVEIIIQGIERAAFTESMIYLQITRGVAPRRHNYDSQLQPSLIMTFRQRPEYEKKMKEQGIALLSVEEIRWQRCDIKSIALLPNIMMKQKALDQGFDEALFVTPTGLVREAAAANFFIIKHKTLITPKADQHILNGITRKFIIAQARQKQLPVEERDLQLEEVLTADEAFISSSTINLLPVVRIDNRKIGNGCPGSATLAIAEYFSDWQPQPEGIAESRQQGCQ